MSKAEKRNRIKEAFAKNRANGLNILGHPIKKNEDRK